MIRYFRYRRAERWDAEARRHREAADLIKMAHDRLVNNGGSISLATFDLYANLIGKAEGCERKAERWRP